MFKDVFSLFSSLHFCFNFVKRGICVWMKNLIFLLLIYATIFLIITLFFTLIAPAPYAYSTSPFFHKSALSPYITIFQNGIKKKQYCSRNRQIPTDPPFVQFCKLTFETLPITEGQIFFTTAQDVVNCFLISLKNAQNYVKEQTTNNTNQHQIFQNYNYICRRTKGEPIQLPQNTVSYHITVQKHPPMHIHFKRNAAIKFWYDYFYVWRIICSNLGAFIASLIYFIRQLMKEQHNSKQNIKQV